MIKSQTHHAKICVIDQSTDRTHNATCETAQSSQVVQGEETHQLSLGIFLLLLIQDIFF